MATDATGAEALVLTPDWSSPIKVSREFRTTIQTSRSGKEQRRAVRNRPRKTVEYSMALIGHSAQTFNQMMKSFVGVDIRIIDVTRSVTILSMTGAVATVSEAPGWLADDVALRSVNNQALALVSGVSGNTVTFASGSAWPVGTKIYPLLTGRIQSGQLTSKLVTDAVQTASITFKVNPLSEPEIDPAAAPVTFNGREVVLAKPNWSTAPEVTFSNAFETVDFNYGAIAHYNPIAYTSRAQKASYLSLNATAAAALEDVFVRAKGQRGEFYMPSWQNDMTATGGAAIGATSFTTSGDVFTYFDGDTVFTTLCICYADGTYQFVQIDHLSTSGGNTTVHLAAALTRAIDSNVTMICWMPVHRFASDTLTTEWITDSVAQTQLPVISLEDLPVE